MDLGPRPRTDPQNATLTAVPGVAVGHWTDAGSATGCTVVLTPQGAVGGIDVRGAAPGTRETDLLDPVNTVEQVHAVLLTGGSAYGLDAAGGVMRWLEERGHGLEVGGVRVPIVCAAVLFDLAVGDGRVRPDANAGYAACEAASPAAVPLGSVGAGTGATVGKVTGFGQATKSGIGSAAVRLGSGVTVAALAAVNAFGDVVEPGGGILAGARSPAGGFAGTAAWLMRLGAGAGEGPQAPLAGADTTLAVIATDAVVTKTQANRLAMVAHDGLARTIDPCHTPFDGDTVFVLGTGASGTAGDLTVLGAAAAHVLAEAVLAAVRTASGLAGIPSLTELDGPSAAGSGQYPGRPGGPAGGGERP